MLAATNMLFSSRISTPVISGTAFPSETLTSTVAGQWYADDVAISGETGATYVVGLDKIGAVIRCGVSNELTIWKPGDIAAVESFWSPYFGVLASVGPDVAAADGQAIRRWASIVGNHTADQTTGVSQPLYRAAGQSGGPSIEFDGSNDFFDLSDLTAFNNVGNALLISGIRDTNPTSGTAAHPVIFYSINGSTARAASYSRRTTDNEASEGRRVNPETIVSVLSPSTNSNAYKVLAHHGDYANGFCRLRINGAVAASAAFSGTGSSTNISSQSARIGGVGTSYFPGHHTCHAVINAAISASDLSKIERYIGLHGGLNIPLV